MRGWVEESCSFPPGETGRKMPEESIGMFAAPGQEFPEKYNADSALQLHSHHVHHSAESGGSWAACGIGAKVGGGGTN